MKYYRLMTSLPPLPEDLSSLPIPLEEILKEIWQDVEGSDELKVQAILWRIDVFNVERFFLKQNVFDKKGTISKEQLENRQDLPDFIEDFISKEDAQLKPQTSIEKLWISYFETILQLGEQLGSNFLKEYALLEIGIRNALAKIRAESIKYEGEIPEILGGEGSDSYAPLIMRALEAKNPVEQARRLDEEKLNNIKELEGIDPFSSDALLAYITRALILNEWEEKKLSPDKLLEVFG